jgi:hypothetical protein
MKYRTLRIAWSVACGILCWLVIVLWVRSHFIQNWLYAELIASQCLELTTQSGCISVTLFESSGPLTLKNRTWKYKDHTLLKGGAPFGEMRVNGVRRVNKAGFGYLWFPKSQRFVFPFWFPAILLTLFGAAPWIRRLHWRYSLRTLLIGMTVVAALLGLVIWAAR